MIAKASATKILASLALVAGAAGVAGLGTFGEFTDSTTASQNVASGTVELTNEETITLSQAITGLVPGDYADRRITLGQAAGSQPFSKVSLAVTSSGASSVLVSDTAKGLQLQIDACSTSWVPAAAGSKELVCATGGTTTSVLAKKAVLGTGDLPAVVTTALNGTAKTSDLRLRFTLPTEADNTFQGKSADLSLAFTAHQRVAEAR